MESKTCAACGQTFQPHHKVPTQTYCSSPVCKKARRQNWQRDKHKSDPDYRDNQRRVQRAWIDRNPDYWREYRCSFGHCELRYPMHLPLDFPAHQSLHVVIQQTEQRHAQHPLLTTRQLPERLGLATITLQIWRSRRVGITSIQW